jgi:surfeit locus 1 family protein
LVATVPARYQFQPRLLTTLAAAAGIAVTLALANWQLNRAHEKEALAAHLAVLAKDAPVALPATEIQARDVEWRRVIARGRFEPRYGVLIDNRVRHGVVGYEVVMPLEIATTGGARRYVLVDRGWVAGNPDRSKLPSVRTPDTAVEIAGLAVTPSRRFLELASGTAQGRVWQNLTLERYRQAFLIAIQPVVIDQESPLDDGLLREWDPPNLGVDRHYGYAFQWSALAVTLLVFYLVTHVRRRPPDEAR